MGITWAITVPLMRILMFLYKESFLNNISNLICYNNKELSHKSDFPTKLIVVKNFPILINYTLTKFVKLSLLRF